MRKKTLKKKTLKKKTLTQKSYLIHDNGGRPFLVNVSDNEINIYKRPDGWYDNVDKKTYTEIVATFKNPIKIFIGKSPKTRMTEKSGGFGSKFKGNTILVNISKNHYVYIGERIYEFYTNDQINEYVSPVGNSDVPYPVAFGEKNIYFMLNLEYIPKDKFPKLKREIKNDMYNYYFNKEELSKYAKTILKMKEVHKRIL